MGCCCSKKLKAEASRGGAKPEARDPPSPEEETVKEVLSETPRPRPRTRARPRVEEEDEAEEEGEEEEDAKKTEEGKEESGEAAGIIGCDERSEEASEAYSVSESLSASMAAAAAAAEKVGAEEAEGRKRQEISSASPSPSPAKIRRKRSLPGEIAARRDRSVAISSVGCRSGTAARRAAEGGAVAVARTHSAREAARTRPPTGNGSAIRRDPGERSGRRSVSPAAAKHRLGGQCRAAAAAPPAQAAKANGRVSPRRIPLAPEEAEAAAEAAAEAEAEAEAKAGAGGDGGDGGRGGAGEGKESLENPLVSLECFIFL